MNRDAILSLPSMPPGNPSYPFGPYRFVNREYFIVVYETDVDMLRHVVPEPLDPDGTNQVYYEWIRMPDSSGFGDYTESGVVIPCKFQDMLVNYTCQMYLNIEPPISAGREIWGFPKRYGHPQLKIINETLTGILTYSGQTVAMGTMCYKHESLIRDPIQRIEALKKTQVNLKLIPHVDGTPAIAQLVAYNMSEIKVKGIWKGPARLHLIPHVNAPVADLPVRRIIGGRHFITDLTLPYGKVIYDYLQK